jgi:hypothetical protein
MHNDTLLRKIYDCKKCKSGQNKKRGCVRPAKKPVWKIDECIHCDGDKNCIYCKGKGKIMVHRCPRCIQDSSLIPYFIAWKNSQYIAYPDGRGRLYQPKKLIQAFDVLGFYWDKFEAQRNTNA